MSTTTPSFVMSLPIQRRCPARAFRFGVQDVDGRAIEGKAIAPSSLTLIAGQAGSGRTTTALRTVTAALADRAGTDRKVVYASLELEPRDLHVLQNAAEKYDAAANLRVAQVRSVSDIALLMATVFAEAHEQAARNNDTAHHYAPALLVIDDALALGVDGSRKSLAPTVTALCDLSADLGTGRFHRDVTQAVGTAQERLTAYAYGRTGSVSWSEVATVMTVRTHGRPGAPTSDHVPQGLRHRANLIVTTRNEAGTIKHTVTKSREFAI